MLTECPVQKGKMYGIFASVLRYFSPKHHQSSLFQCHTYHCALVLPGTTSCYLNLPLCFPHAQLQWLGAAQRVAVGERDAWRAGPEAGFASRVCSEKMLLEKVLEGHFRTRSCHFLLPGKLPPTAQQLGQIHSTIPISRGGRLRELEVLTASWQLIWNRSCKSVVLKFGS